jgi:hypothetical protein
MPWTCRQAQEKIALMKAWIATPQKALAGTLLLLLTTLFTLSEDPLPSQKPLRLPAEIGPKLTVLSAQFGWFAPTREHRELQFVPGDKIPYLPGLHYGWALEVESPLKKMVVTEVLTLPQAPKSWGLPGKYGLTEISDDGKTGTTRTEVAIGPDGMAAKPPWRIVEGDPLGSHHLQLYVGEHLVLDQAFSLVPAEQVLPVEPATEAAPEAE